LKQLRPKAQHQDDLLSNRVAKDRAHNEDKATPSDFNLTTHHDLIMLYLKEIGKTPLLTATEEVTLAKQYEKGRWAQKQLAKIVVDSTEAQTLQEYVREGDQARGRLIRANTRLVFSIAKRYRGLGLPFSDLIQEGNLGLMRAVEKFEYWRGHKFSTYATWWIKQAVNRALANQGRVIRFPVHFSDQIYKLSQASLKLEQTLSRNPTSAELANELGLEEAQVEWILEVNQELVSLEYPLDESGDKALLDFIEDKTASSPNLIDSNLLQAKLEEALSDLPMREAKILKLRFGLEDGCCHTLAEIGQQFGVTRERIRQLEVLALKKLRNSHRSEELREYLT
jgi:RNA polymerase primary sigma factor